MSSRNALQSSTRTESFCPGALNVDLNLPPNIRLIGDSVVLIYFLFYPKKKTKGSHVRQTTKKPDRGDTHGSGDDRTVAPSYLVPSLFRRWGLFRWDDSIRF